MTWKSGEFVPPGSVISTNDLHNHLFVYVTQKYQIMCNDLNFLLLKGHVNLEQLFP